MKVLGVWVCGSCGSEAAASTRGMVSIGVWLVVGLMGVVELLG